MYVLGLCHYFGQYWKPLSCRKSNCSCLAHLLCVFLALNHGIHALVKSARTWSWAINNTPAVVVENRVKFVYQHQTRVVADAKEYLTNRVQLRIGGD